MKVGDLVRYRDRRPTDPIPNPWCADFGEWGRVGIVISVGEAEWQRNVIVPVLEYINLDGDLCYCRQEDMVVINADR